MGDTREKVAELARVSHGTVSKFKVLIEKLLDDLPDEDLADVRDNPPPTAPASPGAAAGER